MSQPTSAEEHYNLGVDFARQSRDEEAIREFTAALHINPRFVEAYNGLGAVYLFQRRTKEAAREFEAALRINPNYIDAHLGLGSVYMAQQRAKKAIREFETVLRIDPNNAQAHRNLGMIYVTQSRGVPDDKAVREFEAAVKLDPDDAVAHYLLAIGYVRQGRWEDGIREGELAEKLGHEEATQWLLKGTDRIIDNLLILFQKFQARPSDDSFNAFTEFVWKHLFAIDARFFNRLNQRIAWSESAAELSHMQELLFTAQSNIIGEDLLSELIELTGNPQLTEREVEAYLVQASKELHFSLYVVVLGMLKHMYESAAALASSAQQHEVTNIQKVIDVASRLAPEAVAVAEQYYQSGKRRGL